MPNPGLALDAILKRFGITGASIARRAGITQQTMNRYRHGGNMNLDTFQRISQALPDAAAIAWYVSISGKELVYVKPIESKPT
ncbi:helix-turn-helix transcriptional regulator [Thermosynechococcaceae cyanobacterium BACA0444]|uniref:Helix-turn-helix transcriptional regulator n=1 Tax=Pseudocalidococcus azoricus BACA0444 TaxID=2918990 RepID=A0AAE4FT75_9CYAN|nr:helix-turn-helix transcriptional regulator [Pseudocalidococcus azoricus]MDS3861785.1 helix-turn-helix transcriptional regulator [Pseudocalidococcus azoricus BACA0444]